MKLKKVWKNRIAKLFAALFFILAACILKGTFLWGTASETVFAETLSELSEGVMKLRAENLEAVLQYGVQGSARYGRKCLVRGTVTSKEGSFRGSIEFVLEDTEGRLQCYEYQVLAEQSEDGSFSAVLPMLFSLC